MFLTPHFTSKEMLFSGVTAQPLPEGKTGKNILMNLLSLAIDLEAVRDDEITGPIRIVSGYRTPEYNRSIGGALRSYHLQGKAVDIKCSKLTASQLHNRFSQLMASGIISDGGLGLYDSWVHYDHGPVGRRWNKQKKKGKPMSKTEKSLLVGAVVGILAYGVYYMIKRS